MADTETPASDVPAEGVAPAAAAADGDEDMFAAMGMSSEMEGQENRVLNQDEIDSLLGFDEGEGTARALASRRSSTARWCLTSVCRCSRSSSTASCA